MANAILKISKRAKQISRANKNKAWKDCIAQASREYKAGKLGAVKKASTRQTGSSNTKRDKQRRAKPPGKRISETGNVYYERRKNRSDKPGTLSGVVKKPFTIALLRKVYPKNMLGYREKEILKAAGAKVVFIQQGVYGVKSSKGDFWFYFKHPYATTSQRHKDYSVAN